MTLFTPPPAQNIKAILGPTNTGKTHYAIERILAHPTGMIGLPLRLLAREVYHKICAQVGAHAVGLITGEERIIPARARYWVATVEAMPADIVVDCLAIDEIQTATDFYRGHVFTNRILNARGRSETLLLGAATMAPIVKRLLPNVQIIHRPRLSALTYSGSKKISRQPRRTAIVAFSAANVYAIAELIRRERGGAAVVMGALSPRTRNAQVDLYQNGDVDFLIATDAIGMGLNLDVNHVAFADDTKFDGHQARPLVPAEFAQIAGRAGRHMRDGTFGVTGNAAMFDIKLIERLEGHEFEKVKRLQWRNDNLDFTSTTALLTSLDVTPDAPELTRAPNATDQLTFEFMARGDSGVLANDPDSVRLMWDCCLIPDYRGISPAQHAHITTHIFTDLVENDRIDTDWIAEQVRFCDNANGDIDTLSNRIKQIRTWTFVSNRKNWLEDPTHWREKTRDIEDRLSDALHERLTQRFVDRRTSVLIRHLRDKHMTSPEINERGEISLEGHLIGTLEGFRFSLSKSADDTDAKALRSAAASTIAPEIRNRALRLANAPNEDFILTTEGFIRWRGEIVAELAEGNDILSPRLIVLADESLSGPELDQVQDRLNLWLKHLINTQLAQIMALREPTELEGRARGIAFRLAENLGILPRQAIATEVRELDQDVRGTMRRLGIKFGAHHIYLPLSLKPAPRELALVLWALKNGGIRQPGVGELPQIILSGRTSFKADAEIDAQLYEIAGFKRAGDRAVRVDILERLADLIRPLIALRPRRVEGELPPGAADGNGFRVTVEMTSLLGCAGEDFSSVLKSLGYRVQRTPVEPTAPEPAPQETAVTSHTPVDADTPCQTSDEVALGEEVLKAAPKLETAAKPATAPTQELTLDTKEPVEPTFDEIWFPVSRHANNKQGAKHGKKSGVQLPNKSGQKDQPTGANAKPHHKGKKPAKSDHKGKPSHKYSGDKKPPRDKPVDPDSPFAALAVLKQKQAK